MLAIILCSIIMSIEEGFHNILLCISRNIYDNNMDIKVSRMAVMSLVLIAGISVYYNIKIYKIKKKYDEKQKGYDKKIEENAKLIKQLMDKKNKIMNKNGIRLGDVECIYCCEPIDCVYVCGHFSFCVRCIRNIDTATKCHICQKDNIVYHKLYL